MAKITIVPPGPPINPALQRSGEKLPVLNSAEDHVTKLIRNTLLEKAKETTLKRALIPIPYDPAYTAAMAEGNSNSSLSLFGLPVWDTVTLSFNAQGTTLLAYTFNLAQVIINQPRNIVRTSVQGMDGEIFEYISDKSYMITINADITSGLPDVRPDADIKDIINLCTIKAPITITNTMLNKNFITTNPDGRNHGINQIIIENYTVSQPEPGMRDNYRVELLCWSDNPALYDIIVQTQR